jgi:ribosomal protein S18 acetylase RimI-like enzyme
VELEIRRAKPEDAAAIAAVHVGSWRETYHGVFPAEKLADLSVEERAEFWSRTLPESSTFVACDGGGVVGFVNAGPSRDPAGVAEIYCLYLLRSHQRRGAGRDLMRACLAEPGPDEVVLWVLESNAGARRFYEKEGFVADGASKPAGIFGCQAPKIRYRRSRHA